MEVPLLVVWVLLIVPPKRLRLAPTPPVPLYGVPEVGVQEEVVVTDLTFAVIE